MSGSDSDYIVKMSDAEDPPEDCGLGHACGFCPREQSCTLNKANHNQLLVEKRLQDLGMVLLVMANKGGVGKSTVSANLAVALSHLGYQVGLADADVHGPNAARIFGLQEARVKVAASGIEPPPYEVTAESALKIGSLAFFLEEDDTPVVWRDAYKHDYIHHMIGSFNWGALDFLVVDMPPGTGNELITLTDMLEGSNLQAVLVSPADVIALQDTLKAARFCKERGVPILGLVENYSGTLCPHCGSEIDLFPRAKEMDRFDQAEIEMLAQLPFAKDIAAGAATGRPAAVDRESPMGQIFERLAQRCAASAVDNHRDHLGGELSKLLETNSAELDFPEHIQQEVQQMLQREQSKLSGKSGDN